VGEFTKGAPTRFVQWSGSSFAAPIVAASAAALLGASPTLATDKVKEALWRTATPPTDWNGVPEVNLGKALATHTG
jgi:subtilisin family serine protease